MAKCNYCEEEANTTEVLVIHHSETDISRPDLCWSHLMTLIRPSELIGQGITSEHIRTADVLEVHHYVK